MYIHQNKINTRLMETRIQTSYIVRATIASFINDNCFDVDTIVMYYHKSSKALKFSTNIELHLNSMCNDEWTFPWAHKT
jgi:hypothetical protein